MRKILFSLFAYFILTTSVFATDYHFCDDGNDTTGDGSAATPWLTMPKAMTTLGSATAGDRVLLCQGGEWIVDVRLYWLNSLSTCLASNPCHLSDYQAPDILPEDVGVKPKLISDNGETHEIVMLSFNGANNGGQGYYISNIEFTTTSDTEVGIFVYNGFDYVTFDNITVDGFNLGLNLENGVPDNIRNYTVINSEFLNQISVGLGGGATNYIVDNNTFTNIADNWAGHAMYSIGHYNHGGISNIQITNNTFLLTDQPNCNTVIMVFHGEFENVRVADNYFHETSGTAMDQCWGIAFDTGYPTPTEHFTNFVVEDNFIENVGLAVSCSSCNGVVIRNNIVFNEQPSTTMMTRAKADDDTITERVVFENNLIISNDVTDGNLLASAIWSKQEVGAILNNDILWNIVGDNCLKRDDTGTLVSGNQCLTIHTSTGLLVDNYGLTTVN